MLCLKEDTLAKRRKKCIQCYHNGKEEERGPVGNQFQYLGFGKSFSLK